jgi:mannosyl-3-phosphoglycerate phosphatase
VRVVFTDLDGTLLDAETYSWAPARPALSRLRRQGIPLIFCTSKTRAEVEVLRRELDNRHPFIVENGGAIFVPRGYYPLGLPSAVSKEAYEVIEIGDPYPTLVAALQRASARSGCRVRGFHSLSAEDISELCGLTLENARLARRREYDEPFLVEEPERVPQLTACIEDEGKRWTRGGRFYHITGDNDKAEAVRQLTALYRQQAAQVGEPVTTIGLGDGLNDKEFLAVVDIPILVRSPQSAELQAAVPHGRLTTRPGPEGWNQAILEVVPE